MRRLGMVFLGFGRMGRAAHAALRQISDRLQRCGIEARLLAVLEADELLIRELPNHTDAKPIFVDTAADPPVAISRLLRRELSLRCEDEFLVYDATPSPCHRGNLLDVCESFPQALYIGEKPLFTDRPGLVALERFGSRVLCDFIESQNEAVLKLLDMQRAGFRIRRLRFWRLNSTGLTKVCAPQARLGVTGGALLDKGIHDLALASILLGNEGTGPVCVAEAMNLALMPQTAEFGKHVSEDSYDATDAAGYARVHWRAAGDVDAEFRYSWIGVEPFDDLCAGLGQPSLRALLRGHGLEEEMWLARAPLEFVSDGLEQQEARVLVVDGTDHGRDTQLVVNFLSRPGVQPFVFHGGKGDFLDLSPEPYYESSLARVFALAIRSYVDGRPLAGTPLGARVIQEAHRLSFDIRQRAFSQDVFSHAEEWVPGALR